MPVTKRGPASITVTRSTRPSSGLKTCVMPIFRPRSPATGLPPRGIQPRVSDVKVRHHVSHSNQLDLDVDARRKVVQPLQRVDRLRRGLQDVDEPLVRADLEVLPRVLVLERRADHAVHVLLGGQRHGPGHRRAGAHGRVHDLLGGRLDRRVVVGLEPDPDLVLRESRHWLETDSGAGSSFLPAPGKVLSEVAYSMTSVTTPEPTVRPPSRMAKRSPSSIAIGWIISTVISTLSPGMTISVPSGRFATPV